MRHLILHLGGSLDRGLKCVQLANQYPDSIIFVSSEDGDVIQYYKDYGISSERVIIDNTAWDTVTNFTQTYQRIKKEFNPQKIFVVTHDFHMKRSMIIAQAVYWCRKVQLIASPSGGPNPYGPKYNFNEPPNIILQDAIRSWIWRLTGILFYWKEVRNTRTEIGSPHKWNEIGI